MKTLLLLVLLALSTGCTPPKKCSCHQDPLPFLLNPFAKVNQAMTSYYVGPNPSKFGSCSELKEYAEQVRYGNYDTGNYGMGGMPSDSCGCISTNYAHGSGETMVAADSTPASPELRDINPNVQEQGLQESDFVKWSTDQVFVAGLKDVTVLDRRTLKVIGKISFSEVIDFSMKTQLLASANNLVVISSEDYATALTVKVYTLQAGALPVLKTTHNFSGTLKEARLQGQQVLLVVEDKIATYPQLRQYPFSEIPMDVDIDEQYLNQNILCTSVIKRTDNENSNQITAVYTFELSKPEELNSIAVLGQARNVYISPDKVFVSDQSAYDPLITQLDYDSLSNRLDLGGVAAINGYALNEWSFNYNEEKNFLSVATTLNGRWPSLQNLRLNTSTKVFETIGSVSGFGTNEDIKSVRYIGDMAYVVTFRQTDPLHIIDNSDPSTPKLVSELVVPGFSTYLHPLNNNILMGVGMISNQTRVQLSLFDIANPLKLSRTDNIEVGYQNSLSDANLTHQAFFYDTNTNLVAIPIVESSGIQVIRSGATFYQTLGSRFSEFGHVSHSDLIPTNYFSMNFSSYGFWNAALAPSVDINRIFKIDGKFLSVSRFGAKFHNALNPSKVEASAGL